MGPPGDPGDPAYIVSRQKFTFFSRYAGLKFGSSSSAFPFKGFKKMEQSRTESNTFQILSFVSKNQQTV